MQIIVNGDHREIPDGLTVAALIEFLQMRVNRVAIERNREILPRAEWQATYVQPNDSFEIVQFVGGGDCTLRRILIRGFSVALFAFALSSAELAARVGCAATR
jgi:thiamine biosynthesis protein ThiS